MSISPIGQCTDWEVWCLLSLTQRYQSVVHSGFDLCTTTKYTSSNSDAAYLVRVFILKTMIYAVPGSDFLPPFLHLQLSIAALDIWLLSWWLCQVKGSSRANYLQTDSYWMYELCRNTTFIEHRLWMTSPYDNIKNGDWKRSQLLSNVCHMLYKPLQKRTWGLLLLLMGWLVYSVVIYSCMTVTEESMVFFNEADILRIILLCCVLVFVDNICGIS